jgi:hypothetical protein
MNPPRRKLRGERALVALSALLTVFGVFACESLLGADFRSVHRASPDSGGQTGLVPDAGADENVKPYPDGDAVLDGDEGARDAFYESSVPPQIEPGEVVGRVLWLEASRGVELNQSGGPRIESWLDQSGMGNHARQANADFAPEWVDAALHGKPALRFVGPITFVSIADAPSLRWGTSDFLLLAAVQFRTDDKALGMIYQKIELEAPFAGPTLFLAQNTARPAAQMTKDWFVQAATALEAVEPYLLGLRRIADTLEIRVNGRSERSITDRMIGVDCTAATPAEIGQNGYRAAPNFQQFDGDIAEILAVAGPLSEATLTGVERYFLAKYGIDTPPR